MPRDRFIHGIVQNFRREVMERPFIRSADIHSGSPPNRLKALENLDIFCGVTAGLIDLLPCPRNGLLRLIEKVANFRHGSTRIDGVQPQVADSQRLRALNVPYAQSVRRQSNERGREIRAPS
jgi:hypothetical protein